MKIAITGATGLIGKKLCGILSIQGHSLTILSRNPAKAKAIVTGASEYVEWDYRNPGSWQYALEGVDSVIHLAGTNIFGKRWSASFKKEIMDSRKISTQNIVNALSNLKLKPKSLICASGINYYGDSGNKLLNEESDPGDDFLARVCIEWESEAGKASLLGIRVVNIRTGIVLDKNGGALARMMLPYKLFIGGPIGSGRQWFPWIHIDDLVNLYLFAVKDGSLNGGINGTAPSPVTMGTFAKSLGKVLHRPSLFKVPAFVLRIVIGESSEAITASVKAAPSKLFEEGREFNFKFKDLDKALEDLLK